MQYLLVTEAVKHFHVNATVEVFNEDCLFICLVKKFMHSVNFFETEDREALSDVASE